MSAGVSGDAVSVEQLVMQIMEQEHEEGVVTLCASNQSPGPLIEAEADAETENTSLPNTLNSTALADFCGGWVGWHCEGSPLRSIFGLVMWSELFPCSAEQQEAQEEGQEEDEEQHKGQKESSGNVNREVTADDEKEAAYKPSPTSSGPSAGGGSKSRRYIPPPHCSTPVADVFRTLYQDAPLDLLTPGGLFYRNRERAIEKKLRWLQAASAGDVITHMGKVRCLPYCQHSFTLLNSH
jgi:hypothetical protein